MCQNYSTQLTGGATNRQSVVWFFAITAFVLIYYNNNNNNNNNYYYYYYYYNYNTPLAILCTFLAEFITDSEDVKEQPSDWLHYGSRDHGVRNRDNSAMLTLRSQSRWSDGLFGTNFVLRTVIGPYHGWSSDVLTCHLSPGSIPDQSICEKWQWNRCLRQNIACRLSVSFHQCCLFTHSFIH